MPKPVLPFGLPSSLSPSVPIADFPGVASLWDVGIGDRGFMLSTLDQESPFEFRSYEVQAIPNQKPRIDDAEEPGEQTLAGWWARAQHSWHEGAGQHVFDSPFSSRFKFSESFGIDIWDDGQFSLLKDTAELYTTADPDVHILAAPNALFYTHDGNVERDEDPDSAGTDTLAAHDGTEIQSICSDGEKLYAAFDGGSLGIKSTPLVGTLAWTDVNDLTDVEVISWVKGRLMGAKGPSVYEFDLSSTDEPEPFYTDPVDGYTFTDITHMGPGIYFAGGVGDRSEVWVTRLTDQDIPTASEATVGALRNVWTAPEGETIYAIHGYGGNQLLIGTSLGVRIGTVTTGEGDLEISPLITRVSQHGETLQGTTQPVKCFEPQLEYAWFGWSNFDSTYTGVGRMDLGNLAWASDLMTASDGEVTDIAYYDGRIYFVVKESGETKIIQEHATNYIESGWLSNQEIRFNTTERKQIRYFDILTSGSGKWSLDMSSDGQAFTAFESQNEAGSYSESYLDLSATRFGTKITLFRDSGDATLRPFVLEWRLRAEPSVTGRFRYFATVMVYDKVETQNGIEQGFVGKAMEDLVYLMNLYRNDTEVYFKGPETMVPNAPNPKPVKLEDLRFKEYTPPEAGYGFGGLCLLIMREVE